MQEMESLASLFWRFVASKWTFAGVAAEYVTAFWRHSADAIRIDSHYGFMANRTPTKTTMKTETRTTECAAISI